MTEGNGRSNHHDTLFHGSMRRSAEAASVVRSLVSESLAAEIDWSAMEAVPTRFVSPELRNRFSDVLYRTRYRRGGEVYLYVLIKHQSRCDPMMPFRLLEYMVRIWNEHLESTGPADRLPAVIPVVVYANARGGGWSRSTELADLIDAPDIVREHLGPYLPRFRFLLDDLTRVDVGALQQRPLTPLARLTLFLLQEGPRNRHLDEALFPLVGDLKAVAADGDALRTLRLLVEYIMTVGETAESDLVPLFAQAGPAAEEAMMTTAEQLIARGRAEGEARGRAEGEARGRAEGEARGRAEGEARGRAEGEARGVAKALLNLIRLKFGQPAPEVVERVMNSSVEEITDWTGHILTASTLEDLLG
ncbi:Rpn family recombination-promoting nuclease/putative transposase [Nocardia thailandica]